MKSFKEFYYTEAENFYKVGDKVKVDLSKVGSYMNINELGGEDAGTIKEVGGNTYSIKFSNNNIAKIKKEDVYSLGDTDTGP